MDEFFNAQEQEPYEGIILRHYTPLTTYILPYLTSIFVSSTHTPPFIYIPSTPFLRFSCYPDFLDCTSNEDDFAATPDAEYSHHPPHDGENTYTIASLQVSPVGLGSSTFFLHIYKLSFPYTAFSRIVQVIHTARA